MENPKSRVEVLKPILKAGIPLALSVVGFIYAKIVSRRILVPIASTSEIQEESIGSHSSEDFCDEESYHSFNSTHYIDISGNMEILLGQRTRIQVLQERECKLYTRFLRYCDLKEQETALVQLENMLTLEMGQIELLCGEVSSMEEENQMLEGLANEFLRIVEQRELSREENRLLHRRVNELSVDMTKQSQVTKDHNSRMEEKEAEISNICEELDVKTNMIKALENESQELQGMVHQLQTEKTQLINKLELAEKSTPLITKDIEVEDYNQLANALHGVQNERAAEIKELTYLRWSNACLRHELMRNHEQYEGTEKNQNHFELDFEGNGGVGAHGMENKLDGSILEHAQGTMTVQGAPDYFKSVKSSSHDSARRPKLLQKLKRKLVEGRRKREGKSNEKLKVDANSVCYGRHSVSEGVEELPHGRWSWSKNGTLM